MPRFNSNDPTDYALICKSIGCGRIFLDADEYMRQLTKADSKWVCPFCGEVAQWDDSSRVNGITEEVQPAQAAHTPAVLEVDPITEKITGNYQLFCSEKCQRGWQATKYKSWRLGEGTFKQGDCCHRCGKEIGVPNMADTANDPVVPETPRVDLLKDIFTLQTQLNNNIFKKKGMLGRGVFAPTDTDPMGLTLTMAEIQKETADEKFGPNDLPNTWLRNYLRALKSEADELEESLLWKWWSKDLVDMQNARVEIIDMMHFLVSLALTAGLTAEEFHRLYTAKHRVNENRQDTGYSKETKNEADNKAIV